MRKTFEEKNVKIQSTEAKVKLCPRFDQQAPLIQFFNFIAIQKEIYTSIVLTERCGVLYCNIALVVVPKQ